MTDVLYFFVYVQKLDLTWSGVVSTIAGRVSEGK